MKKIIIYNTLTRKKEEFKPLKSFLGVGFVKFYHCGPTVYWTQHIGNLRGMFCADIIVRTLRYFGYRVKHERNYTDVGHLTSDEDEGEDKMEKGVKRENLNPEQIANKYIKIFENDTKSLNLLEPDYKPRATECIQDIINMVQILLKKGYAYQTDLAIYFDTSKFENYYQLSGQKGDKNIAGAGTGKISDKNKKNFSDFALWFFKAGVHKNALQTWESPFFSPLVKNGEGFPGWHIECSAMIKKYLGNTIDIHMGGIEHIPVHHTNEIAQSESANGVKLANYWVHNNHLLVDNKKMSKSEGTSYLMDDIKKKGFDPLALRYFFLQAHYRAKQNFTWEALEAAQKGLEHLQHQVCVLGSKKGKIDKTFRKKFSEKIADDFNTPEALAIISEILKSGLNNRDKLATILSFDKILGLDLKNIIKKQKLPKYIKKLIKKRDEARRINDWNKSDELRDKIQEKGYIVEDFQGKTRVYKK